MNSNADTVEDKRRHPRIQLQSEVLLELTAPGWDGAPGEIVNCNTVDVAYGGVRLGLDKPLLPGAIFNLDISISALGGSFSLVGQVAWCHSDSSDTDAWYVGLFFLDGAETDIERWRESMADL